MPRLRRKLFAALTILSLLLCIASAGMWVRSYYGWDNVKWWRSDGRFGIGVLSGDGGLVLWSQRSPPKDRYLPQIGFSVHSRPDDHLAADSDIVLDWEFDITNHEARRHAWHGFGVAYGGVFHGMVESAIVLPHWFLCLLSALLPLYWLKKKRKRPSPGRCAKCGYDLRATPDRCPECGTVPPLVS